MTVVENEVYRLVERQLYTYYENIRLLREQRIEILLGTQRTEREGGSKAHKSDPTALRGQRLARLDESLERRWADCITDAVQAMSNEYQHLVELKYFEKWPNDQVMKRLHVGRSTYYEWRDGIIFYIVLLATQRGLIKPIREAK